MSNDNEKPMTEDQVTDLKVATKLKKEPYEGELSEAEADKRLKEINPQSRLTRMTISCHGHARFKRSRSPDRERQHRRTEIMFLNGLFIDAEMGFLSH